MLIVRDAASDYANRDYLSVVEVAAYTGLPVREIHRRVIWTPRAIAPIREYAITWAERDKLAALLEGKTL